MSAPAIRSAKTVAWALALPVLGLAACNESTGPNGGGGGGTAPPQPTIVYDLEIETRYIEIIGSCDADDIFGNPTNGEFQFRITVSGEGQSHAHESSGYNTFLGSNYARKAGETINFTNRRYTWQGLDSLATVRVRLSASEWDTAVKDSRMNNDGQTRILPFRSGGGRMSNDVIVGGSSSCAIKLWFYQRWTPRQVQP